MAYRVLRVIIRALLRFVWHLRIEGIERLPSRGPYILAPNHPSELDPVILSAAFSSRLAYLASRHLQEIRWVFWFIRQFGDPVWVRRGLGDVSAMKVCLSRLQAGEILVIFPEGRVVQDVHLGPFHSGAAFLAIRGHVPVVPIALLGVDRMLPLGARWPRPARISIRIGVPLLQPEGNGANADFFTKSIEQSIKNLLLEPPTNA